MPASRSCWPITSRWAEAECQPAATFTERRASDAEQNPSVSLAVATALTASQVAKMSRRDQEGKVPLAEELAFHLDVLGVGLAEPERSRTCATPARRP